MDITLPENIPFWAIAAVIGELIAYLNIPSVLLQRGSRPLAQLVWILTLVALPFVGVVAWWAWGRNRLERKRVRHRRSKAAFDRALQESETPPTDFADFATKQIPISDHEVFPTTQNNCVQRFTSGRESYPAMLQAIEAATHHIHMEFYIWNDDEQGVVFRDALVKKAKEGVEVRVLLDAVGSSSTTGRFMKPLREAGGEVITFLPLRLFERRLRVNFRNHRKIVVIDGSVGFTGGLNIGNEYNSWLDSMFGFTGPVVNQLQVVFCEDWYFATNQDLTSPRYYTPVKHHELSAPVPDVVARIVASGPDNDLELIHSLFFVAITRANERVWITTPYFVPDDAILAALRTAVFRGVDVRLMLPGKSDVAIAQWAGRAYFEPLLRAGVRIFEYQPSVLHAKQMIIDDAWTIIGSANLDIRSFRLQFEANAAIWCTDLNQEMTNAFVGQIEQALEIDLKRWCERSQARRLGEAAARLLSPQL